ncbi:putative ribonuclease H-like domain-containing protein [Tanacetum coccineum]|uniref:Ribonuclease H-like domain-containing protein n=1 Tax=Tanacetum coccineum TaxID=301880 RepID=A0ABQ5EGT4_9ASTR
MARFDNGFLSDLTVVRDNIILRVRIVRTWMQPMRNNPKVINMELIIMDEQDETGTSSLVLFKKEVKSLLNGVSAYQLLETRERNGKLDEFPYDFNQIIDRKYAFKINMDDWQSKKELPLWTVMKMSDDHEIINALIPLITSSKNRTNHKDHQNCLLACFLSEEEPKNITQALQDEIWVEAMQEELLQFKLQKVWVLVDLPYGKNEDGIYYDEVFAPVARIEAIRLYLAFASYMGFTIYQMDVKSAFLYGTIGEEVYVHQPLGFVDLAHPNKVYKGIKALYGLH